MATLKLYSIGQLGKAAPLCQFRTFSGIAENGSEYHLYRMWCICGYANHDIHEYLFVYLVKQFTTGPGITGYSQKFIFERCLNIQHMAKIGHDIVEPDALSAESPMTPNVRKRIFIRGDPVHVTGMEK